MSELPPPLRNLSSYRVLEPLGDGGMGVVYRALDLERKEVVALKTLRRMSPVSFTRLKSEFRAVADVVHPNLVALHELLIEDGIPYFTMELIDGVDFLTYVRGDDKRRILDEDDIALLRDAIGQLALGVAALHRAGKVHRDLKRNNVLVTSAGRVVLLDFGLAVDSDRGADAEPLVGTPAYMAPEQVFGEKVSAAADWFAVGVMLYRALTGTLPVGNTTQERIDTMNLLPPAPSVLVGELPKDLDELCLALLAPDPEKRPSDDEVLQWLGVGLEPAPAELRGGPLVGRTQELATLDAALASAESGQCVVALVSGASGVGKTTLVRSWLGPVAAEGRGRVMTSRCRERESFAYKAFDGLVEDVARHLREHSMGDLFELVPPGMDELARLFPAFDPWTSSAAKTPMVDRKKHRREAFRCLKLLLTSLAEREPLVLWIDDLHWIDADSVGMLDEILSPPAPPLLLVCTTREAGRMRWHPGVAIRDMPIEPLSLEESASLARALVEDGVDKARLDEIAEEALGNPFLIEQMVRHAQEGGTEAVSLDAVVRARTDKLPEDARRVLEIVAVAGHPIPQSVAIAVASPSGDAWAAISLLRSSNLVKTRGARASDPLEAWHDRIRETVVEQLAHTERARCHAAIGLALEDDGDVDPALLAAHFHAAWQRDKAGPYALRAAEQAASALAFDRAAKLYAMAIACNAGDRIPLLRAQADALVDGGRCAEAAPLYREAADATGGDLSLELRRLAAEQLMVTGRLDEGVAQLRPVLHAADLSFPRSSTHAMISVLWRFGRLKLRGLDFVRTDEARAPAHLLRQIDLCWTAVKGLLSFDSITAAHFLFTMLDRALRAGEPHRASRALMVFGMVLVFQGDPRSHREGSRIIDLGGRGAPPGDRYLEGLLEICHGTAEMSIGAFRRGLEGLARGIHILEANCPSVGWECSAARSSTFTAMYWLGDVSEIAKRAAAWHRDGERIGDLFVVVTAELYGAHAKLASGDPDGARAAVNSAMRKWSQNGFHYQHWLAEKIRIRCDLYEGDQNGARRRFESCMQPLKRSGLLRVQLMEFDACLLEGLVTLAGSPSHAELNAVKKIARRLGRMGRPTARAGAELLHAEVARSKGRRKAAQKLRAAAAAFDDNDMRAYTLAARRRAAVLEHARHEIETIDDDLRAMGVADPARWAALYA